MRSKASLTAQTALRTLLELHGLNADGSAILLAMEAPYLFLRRNGRYIAGRGFLSPEWLNNYLLPRGFRLTTHSLPRKDYRHFLQQHSPAVLPLPGGQALLILQAETQHVCLQTAVNAPQQRLTFPTLLKKLPESFTAYTLETCPPTPVDVIPLLCESISTLAAWRKEYPAKLKCTVNRHDMQPLHQQFFRALMVDIPVLAHLYTDDDLIPMLAELLHVYRHLFIYDDEQIYLEDHLPRGITNRCVLMLQELILDRLDALGAPDELLEPLYKELHL